MNVLDEIALERQHQSDLGFNKGHDDQLHNGALARAAAAYAWLAGSPNYDASKSTIGVRSEKDYPFSIWPFDTSWWKPKGRRKDLVRAAALIVAEIERIDREKHMVNF